MASLQFKNWFSQDSAYQKFLASVLSHHLSRMFNRKDYEVVNESYIDLHNMDSDVADVIVYNINNNFSADLIIELCTNEDLKSTLNSVEIISEIYRVKEAFVYNTSTSTWYKINDTDRDRSSYSRLLDVNLDDVLKTAILKYAA